MRQVLFRISLGKPWAFWSRDPVSGWPEVGFIWFWLVAAAAYLAYDLWIDRQNLTRNRVWTAVAIWLAGIPLGMLGSALIVPFINRIRGNPAPPFDSFPLFGYGTMVMLGFLMAVLAAKSRAKRAGLDPELVWDAGVWLLLGGVLGGRLFFILQYHREVYRGTKTLGDVVFATINLSAGGLVLIGALLGGGLGFWAYARRRKIETLNLADIFTPSVFIGIGLGRIGCLLNGCCYGDRCILPWGIRFPRGSVTFEALKERGFVDAAALFTMPLHPTQIYSSIDGFLLALITALLFRERRWHGEVFAWGCVMYSCTRFLMEFVRGDEMGQLGTGLTISQIYSMGIAVLGIAILIWHARRPAAIPAPARGGR
jgi:phosphatidylglycerol---prolipoprotein diacylglyceryl transferase